MGYPSKSLIYSLDCLLIKISGDNFSITFIRLYWTILMVILYIGLISLGYYLYSQFKHNKMRKEIITNSILFLFLYF